jgi:predicted transcriptional regulator
MKKGRPLKTVARRPVFKYHEPMEVQLTFDQEAKLTRMATEQGRAAETLVQEAVERFLNYDEWFSREVDKGLAAADRGEFVEHDDIRKMIDRRYPA